MPVTRRQFLGAAAGAAAVGAGASARADGYAYAVQGIDVSQWQGNVNWDQVATANKKFCFHKATEGTTFVDPKFATNWPEVKRIGLLRGAYHMVRPSSGDPKGEVDHFLSVAQPSSGDLRPMLDLERDETMPAAAIWRHVQLVVARIKFKLGKTPFLYTNYNYWHNVMGDPHSNLDCPLWLARYGDTTDGYVHTAWKTWTLWQYTNLGKIPGITENTVDLDAFNGTLADLNKYRLP